MIQKILYFLLISFISFTFFLEAVPQPLPQGLPSDIEGYSKWTRLNKKIIKPREADPHFGFKRVYINKDKNDLLDSNNKQIFPYPEETIIVKEVRKTKNKNSRIVLVSIMRKLPGNETTGGWDFVEYTRSQDGSFSQIAFPKESCYACHQGASDRDAVWTKFDNF